MLKTMKLLTGVSGIAFSAFAATGAYANGTTAGSSIVNNVTVNYQVGGVGQTAINASNTITVDRKITLTVAEVGTTTTTVAPGQTAAVTSFIVTNTSNAPLDLGLTASQQTGGTGPHGGTDNFDVTAGALYVDTNADGDYDVGVDLAVTYLDEVAADASRTVFYVANIPAGQANGSVAVVGLTATAREAGTAGTQGAVVTQTAGANTAGQDTVFGDTAGTVAGDTLYDGEASARDDYTVAAAALSVVKTSRPISDPFNGTTNPKLIPGAVVEYCIEVTNAAGGAAATTVAITDIVPAQTTYQSAFGIFVDGTTAAGVCSGGTASGTYNAGTTTVSGTIASIAAGNTRTLYFRATIN